MIISPRGSARSSRTFSSGLALHAEVDAVASFRNTIPKSLAQRVYPCSRLGRWVLVRTDAGYQEPASLEPSEVSSGDPRSVRLFPCDRMCWFRLPISAAVKLQCGHA